MGEFKFKTVDTEGLEILESISDADNFNGWMYKTIKPFTKGNILEIGSGIGNISKFFLNDNAQITLSDIRENYCSALEQKFSTFSNLKNIELMNLTDENFEQKFSHLLGTFDTVFAMNVVEHIYDDNLAIENCHKLLKPGGHCIILVPAYQRLYNKFDHELEHYRRYSEKSLNKLFHNNQFKIIHNQYFNFAGIAGWFVSGKLQGNKSIPKGQMSFYNKLVPLFKLADKVLFNKVGLSVITVGRK